MKSHPSAFIYRVYLFDSSSVQPPPIQSAAEIRMPEGLSGESPGIIPDYGDFSRQNEPSHLWTMSALIVVRRTQTISGRPQRNLMNFQFTELFACIYIPYSGRSILFSAMINCPSAKPDKSGKVKFPFPRRPPARRAYASERRGLRGGGFKGRRKFWTFYGTVKLESKN